LRGDPGVALQGPKGPGRFPYLSRADLDRILGDIAIAARRL